MGLVRLLTCVFICVCVRVREEAEVSELVPQMTHVLFVDGFIR